jgi:hypothetical protein
LTGNVAEKHFLRVVAWSQAVGIIHVDEAVSVVVEAIAAVVQMRLAMSQLTSRGRRIRAARAWRTRLSVAQLGKILADEDVTRACDRKYRRRRERGQRCVACGSQKCHRPMTAFTLLR